MLGEFWGDFGNRVATPSLPTWLCLPFPQENIAELGVLGSFLMFIKVFSTLIVNIWLPSAAFSSRYLSSPLLVMSTYNMISMQLRNPDVKSSVFEIAI